MGYHSFDTDPWSYPKSRCDVVSILSDKRIIGLMSDFYADSTPFSRSPYLHM